MRASDRRELLFVIYWSALVAALTAVPYVIAQSWAGANRCFGGFLWGPDEGNVYLAWIRQASEGHLFLANQYTIAAQKPHFFNVFLTILGEACHYLGLTPLEAFHAARLLGIPVAIYAFYRLVAYLTGISLVRVGAVVLVTLASGFGWIFTLYAYAGLHTRFTPMDCASGWQVMPEAVTFLSFLLNPLFTWSLALLSATLLWAFRSLEKRSFGGIVVAGLFLLVLGNVHTYDAFTAYAATFLWLLFLWKRRLLGFLRGVGLYAILLVLSVPAILWARYASAADPAYLAKINTPTLSPPFVDYFLGYGLVGIAALMGAAAAWKLRGRYQRPVAPLLWALATFIFVYLPVSFQRKMIEGVHLSLAFLAAYGLVVGLPFLAGHGARSLTANERWRRRRRLGIKAIVLVCALSIPSNIVFVYDSLMHVAANNADLLSVLMPPAYLTKDDMAGLNYLAAHTTFDDIVLSSSLIGSYIPPHCAARVVAGHWAETLHFPEMVKTVATFYAPGLDPGIRADILRKTGATYIWWGRYEHIIQRSMLAVSERAVSGPIPLPDPPNRGLRKAVTQVFHHGDVVIYRVSRSQLQSINGE